jgi:hypothetical protein
MTGKHKKACSWNDTKIGGDELHNEVLMCRGEPMCPFKGGAAIENQLDGCPRCKRIRVSPDGQEIEYQAKGH